MVKSNKNINENWKRGGGGVILVVGCKNPNECLPN